MVSQNEMVNSTILLLPTVYRAFQIIKFITFTFSMNKQTAKQLPGSIARFFLRFRVSTYSYREGF